MKPLFMWAGGKSKMLKHYIPLMPSAIESYSEPFFGGGAIFLHVMANYAPKNVFLNDINKGIMGIYKSIKDDLPSFLSIMDTYSSKYLPLSQQCRKKFFYDLRDENAYTYSKWSPTKESATLYFLMKTAFNGIWQINKNTNGRFGTPSGLLNQTTAVYDKDTVTKWNQLLNSTNCILTSADWSTVPISSFTFYDPPYRDSFADYNAGFPDTELEKIVAIVEAHTGVWVTNRDANDNFWDNRKGCLSKFPVTYTAGRRKRTNNGFAAKKAIEILFTN